jgi:eukaryotic-like serine/threonine-protein kinase
MHVASPAGQPTVIRFGVFEVDSANGELRKAGIPLKIHPQPFRVLLLLTERSGEIVTREEIQCCLWGNNTFVDFDRGINFCVNQIRSALADDAENPRYIETVPRKGYRFMVSCTLTRPTKEEAPLVNSLLAQTQTLLSSEPPKTVAPMPAQFPSRPDIHLVPSALPRAVTLRSIRKIAVPVIGALLAIAILTCAVLYFRGSPKLTEKDTVVLADFNNATGDPVFDDALKQGLAVQLSQSPFLNIVSDQSVRETLKLMGRSPGERLTADVAQEVCRRDGSKAYFTGSIASLSNQYVIALNAMNCETGDSLAREQVTANGKEQVLKALGAAATKLRKQVGESLATVHLFDVPIEQASTTSLEALQAYSLGRMAITTDPSASASFFQRTIRLDPNFAMAYAALGNAYSELGESTLAIESAKKAYELRERTSEREKFYIDSHYYAAVGGNLKKAEETYELWAHTYPRDPVPVGNLGAIYRDLGELDKRLSVNLKDIQLDPQDVGGYYGAAGAYLSLDRFAEARAVANEALAKNLDSYRLRLFLYQLSFLQNDAAGMAEQVNWSMGKAGIEDQFLNLEASSAAYFGRLKKARELWKQAAESARRSGQTELAAGYEANLLEEADFGNFAVARRKAATALSLTKDADTQMAAAEALARIGDSVAAEKLADALAKQYPQDTIVNNIGLPTIRATVEIDRRNPLKAIETLSGVSPYELGSVDQLYSAYLRGLAYSQLKRGAEAAGEFRRIINHRGVVRNAPIGALAHLQLARAYSLESNAAGARTEYQFFLTLWKDADSDIPVLRQAQREYAKTSL